MIPILLLAPETRGLWGEKGKLIDGTARNTATRNGECFTAKGLRLADEWNARSPLDGTERRKIQLVRKKPRALPRIQIQREKKIFFGLLDLLTVVPLRLLARFTETC